MALPAEVRTVTLTGTYQDLATGTPISGSVRFEAQTPAVLDSASNAVLVPAAVEVTLDASGHFAQSLPATDTGPSLQPTAGWAYKVTERFAGGRTYMIYLPYSGGSTQDISRLSPIAGYTPVATGPTGLSGRGFTPRGAWAPTTPYAVDDVVTNGGSTYRCKVSHTSGATFSGPGANWELWAQAGATGPTGNTGATGSTGPQGSPAVVNTTSTTSLTVGTGSQTFATAAALNLPVGSLLRAWLTGTPGTYMLGTITAISGTTVTVNVTETSGSGTVASWTLAVSGLTGLQGPTGATGSQGPTGATGATGPQGPAGAGASDATTSAKGSVQLAGDLAGTAAAPTVTGGTHHSHTSAQVTDAVYAATPATLALRNAQGALQVANPASSGDAVNVSYLTGLLGAPNGVAQLDGYSGLLVPTYAEMTQYTSGQLPAAPATGKVRLAADSNGRLQVVPPSGAAVRRVATHWGTGTAFPTGSPLAAGDTFVRSDIGQYGSVWQYTGNSSIGASGWVLESPPTVTSGDVVAGLYSGQQRLHPTYGMQQWNGSAWKKLPGVPSLVVSSGANGLSPGSSVAPGGTGFVISAGLTIPAHSPGTLAFNGHATLLCTNTVAGYAQLGIGPSTGSLALFGGTARFHNNGNSAPLYVPISGYYDTDGTTKVVAFLGWSDAASNGNYNWLVGSLQVWQL